MVHTSYQSCSCQTQDMLCCLCSRGLSRPGQSLLGTHKQVSKHVNAKTTRLCIGVGQDEYNAVIQEHWVLEGNKLFQQAGKWADK